MGFRRLLVATIAVTAVLPATPAFALRGETVQGKVQPPEFGSRDLARIPDASRQAALTSTHPAWKGFLAVHPGPWRVTWDDRAGTPRSIIGGTIPLVAPTASKSAVERASRNFLSSLSDLSGVPETLLATKVLTKVGDTWFARFDRVTADGTPVAGAYAELRIVKGNVVLIRLETHPLADSGVATRKLAGTQAIAKAHQSLGMFVPVSALKSSISRAVIVPIPTASGWTYRPAYEVDTVTPDRSGHWRSTVDATFGDVLSRESVNRYDVGGTFTAAVEARLPGDAPVSEGLSFVQPTVGGTPVNADAAGAWTSTAAAPAAVSAMLSGPFVHVANQQQANAAASFTANDLSANYEFNGGNATLPEVDAYRHIVEARNWALTVTPSNSWLASQLTVNINLNDTCNSFWNGESVNLFREDSQCNNTARIADVVYHEFGHGFHQNDAVSGTIDGAIGEGSGDYIAVTITGDHLVGPKFFKSGGEVRDVEPDRVYPDDLAGEVHEDGLIWAGALWDLRKAMIAKLADAAAGAHATDLLFAKALSAGPTLDQAYDEVMLADDDDGNLANGTPNQCEIEAAFGAHGLVGSVAALTHAEVLGPIAATSAIPVSVSAAQTGSVCPGNSLTGVDLKYTIDGGAAQAIALTASGSDWAGTVPALASEGHVVRYWFEGHRASGANVLTPPQAPQNSFGFYVGPLFTVWHEDFEGDTSGWTHGGTNDDWTIGTPHGQGSDPAAAYSGAKILGNNLNGDYSPDSDEWALSPKISCGGCSGTHLQLRRWLAVEDASYDHASIYVNNQQVYANPVGAGAGGALPRDPMWAFEDYDISSIADGHNIRIKFNLQSDQGAEYGGWNIDDIAIVTPAEPTPVSGGKGCGCDLGGSASVASTLVPSLLGLAALVVRRKRIG